MTHLDNAQILFTLSLPVPLPVYICPVLFLSPPLCLALAIWKTQKHVLVTKTPNAENYKITEP